MTKISTITGMVNRPYYNQNAVSGNVPEQPVLDYAALSSGELRLALIRRQLDILTSVHPDNSLTNERKQAMTRIDNILTQGVHGLGSLTGSFWWGGEAGRIASEIKKAVKRSYPASYNHVNTRQGGVNGAFELLSENSCSMEEIARRMQGAPQSVIDAAYYNCQRDAQANLRDVQAKNEIRSALNNDLEKSSHSPIYEFLLGDQYTQIKNVDAVLGDKIQKHRAFADFIVQTAGLEKDNVRLWMRNGIMAQNAASAETSLGALSPEDSILLLASHPTLEYRNGQPHIGVVLTVGMAIAWAIIAIAAAIAINSIIQTIQKREPTALNYIGSLATLAGIGSGKDFAGQAGKILLPNGTGNTGTGPGTTCPTGFTKNAAGVCVPDVPAPGKTDLPEWALPVGAAAAAYFLLSK